MAFTSILTALLLLVCTSSLVIGHDSSGLTDEFAEPLDDTNKLLYDLDQHIISLINRQELAKPVSTIESSATNLAYSGPAPKGQLEIMMKNTENEEETPKETHTEENNIATLLKNLAELDQKLQGTFQDLQTRRRFVLGAMIRQMQGTVRRIRSNVARMQVQLSTIESVATQVPLIRPNIQALNATDGAASALNANKESIEQIEQRINTVSKRINDIVTRLGSSLSSMPGSAERLNPIITLNSIIQSHGNRGGSLLKPPKN